MSHLGTWCGIVALRRSISTCFVRVSMVRQAGIRIEPRFPNTMPTNRDAANRCAITPLQAIIVRETLAYSPTAQLRRIGRRGGRVRHPAARSRRPLPDCGVSKSKKFAENIAAGMGRRSQRISTKQLTDKNSVFLHIYWRDCAFWKDAGSLWQKSRGRQTPRDGWAVARVRRLAIYEQKN